MSEEGTPDANRIKNAIDLLPAWFIPRMMESVGAYAFILSTGATMHIQIIDDVKLARDNTIWLDIRMRDEVPPSMKQAKTSNLTAPTSRTRASVQAGHVVSAFETIDGP